MGLSAVFGGAAAAPNFGAANGYMSTLGGIARGMGSQASTAAGAYGANQAQDQTAINSYDQYLQANPATQGYNAGQVAGAEQGASENAAGATAQMDQSLAARGIAPTSGIAAGALSNIDEGLAANNASIQSNVGQANVARHEANLGTAANLMSGATNASYDQDMGFTGAQTGIDQGLTSDADTQAMQQYQAALQTQDANDQLYGALGNMAGASGLLGKGAMMAVGG